MWNRTKHCGKRAGKESDTIVGGGLYRTSRGIQKKHYQSNWNARAFCVNAVGSNVPSS